jgi:transposase InsO family protein
MARFFKQLLTRVGAHVSARTIHRVNAALNYLEAGRWMKAHGFAARRRVRDRREIYEQVAAEVGAARALYLEFGVHRGESMRIWSGLLRHPEARLVGFDSFEGLPEDWNLDDRRGTFSTGGAPPVLPDSRVEFVRGWFEATLPGFTPPPHERLVLHLDADLYSSTATVLRALERWIVPGSFVLFDEFADRMHELRAFDEFLRTHPGWRFRLVASDEILARVAFERVS